MYKVRVHVHDALWETLCMKYRAWNIVGTQNKI